MTRDPPLLLHTVLMVLHGAHGAFSVRRLKTSISLTGATLKTGMDFVIQTIQMRIMGQEISMIMIQLWNMVCNGNGPRKFFNP